MKHTIGDWRDTREMPILVFHGREAERLEALHPFGSKADQPLRLRAPRRRSEALEISAIRIARYRVFEIDGAKIVSDSVRVWSRDHGRFEAQIGSGQQSNYVS